MIKFTKVKKRAGYVAQGDEVTIELGLCPFCGSLTDFRGEFLPCCGEDIDTLRSGRTSITVTFRAEVVEINELDHQKLSAFWDRHFKERRAEWKS